MSKSCSSKSVTLGNTKVPFKTHRVWHTQRPVTTPVNDRGLRSVTWEPVTSGAQKLPKDDRITKVVDARFRPNDVPDGCWFSPHVAKPESLWERYAKRVMDTETMDPLAEVFFNEAVRHDPRDRLYMASSPTTPTATLKKFMVEGTPDEAVAARLTLAGVVTAPPRTDVAKWRSRLASSRPELTADIDKALDPTTTVAGLFELAEHDQPEVRKAVAMAEKSPPRLLARMATKDMDFGVRSQASRNPRTPATAASAAALPPEHLFAALVDRIDDPQTLKIALQFGHKGWDGPVVSLINAATLHEANRNGPKKPRELSDNRLGRWFGLTKPTN